MKILEKNSIGLIYSCYAIISISILISVSEINSPCESDSESNQTGRARNYAALKGNVS